MSEILATAATLFQPLAMAVALVYSFNLLARWRKGPLTLAVGVGVLFGVAVLFSMATPIEMGEGWIVDQRNLLIFVSGAFFGPLAGIITTGFGIGMRVEVGGAGTMIGSVSMLISYATAVGWYYLVPRMHTLNLPKLAVMGVVCSSHLVVAFWLPAGVKEDFVFHLVPFIAIGNLVGTLLLGSLILRETKLLAEGERLQEEAALDPLTRLLNRRSLIEAVERPNTSTQVGRAMLYFDIDNFKTLNDTYGHAVGDKVLQEISSRIRECLRPDDLFARIGGDEFVVVLPNVKSNEAESVAHRCHAVIAGRPMTHLGAALNITISLGAKWSDNPPLFDAQLEQADEALYVAKKAGRNMVHFVGKEPVKGLAA